MDVELKIEGPDFGPGELESLTDEVCDAINNRTSAAASVPRLPDLSKDPATIGTILLAFMSSGTAVALCAVMSDIIKNRPKVRMKVVVGDKELTIDAQGIESEVISGLIDQLKDIFPTSSDTPNEGESEQ